MSSLWNRITKKAQMNMRVDARTKKDTKLNIHCSFIKRRGKLRKERGICCVEY